MLSPFLFVVVVDVVTEFGRGALGELPYADDLVLMSENCGTRDKVLKWRESFYNKVLKRHLWKTKVMVSSGITQDGLSKSKIDPCEVCSMRVMADSVLCVQCGKWIHGRCAGVKMVSSRFSRNFTCRKC